MKKYIIPILIAAAVVFNSGCSTMSDDSKVELISSSVRIASMVGTQVAIQEEPESKEYFPLVSEAIRVTIAEQDDLTNLSTLVNDKVEDIVPSEYANLTPMAIAESFALFKVFLNENPELISSEQARKIASSIADGIDAALGLSLKQSQSGGTPAFKIGR